jgi:hypothetical protein
MRALMILALVATSTLATSNFEIDSVIGKLKEKVDYPILSSIGW